MGLDVEILDDFENPEEIGYLATWSMPMVPQILRRFNVGTWTKLLPPSILSTRAAESVTGWFYGRPAVAHQSKQWTRPATR